MTNEMNEAQIPTCGMTVPQFKTSEEAKEYALNTWPEEKDFSTWQDDHGGYRERFGACPSRLDSPYSLKVGPFCRFTGGFHRA